MLVLGIESSCDETAAAIVEDGRTIRSSIVASQNEIHSPFGGVVPELACRQHVKAVDKVVFTALEEANIHAHDVDAVSAVNGPGLIGALLIGLSFAKSLAFSLKVPLIPVHHIEAHLYAAIMSHPEIPLPAIGLVVSGGHTMLFEMKALGSYRFLGSTVDDAVGEAFDKVASLLGLPYLGGPLVEQLAKEGDPTAIQFPRAMMKKPGYDFSYSGLKTAVMYELRGYGKKQEKTPKVSHQRKADIAASFQEAAFDVLVKKTLKAAKECQVQSIVIGGGVSRNQRLRDMFAEAGATAGIGTFFPDPAMCTDNAAMVAGLGYHMFTEKNLVADFNLDAHPNLKFL